MTDNKGSCLSKSGKTEPALIWSTYKSQCKCIKSFSLEVDQNQCLWQRKGKLQYVIGIVLTKGGQAEEQAEASQKLKHHRKEASSNIGVAGVQSPRRVWPFGTPWTAARQASHPTPSPGVCPSSCPLYQWRHPAISSSDTFFSFCPQSFPASVIVACQMWGSLL